MRGQLLGPRPCLRQKRVSCSGVVPGSDTTSPTVVDALIKEIHAALAPEFKKAVDTYVQEHKVLIFIKGSKVRSKLSSVRPSPTQYRTQMYYVACRTSRNVDFRIQLYRYALDQLRPVHLRGA
jgi:hypothetical protein